MLSKEQIAEQLLQICARDFGDSPVAFARVLGMSYYNLKQYLDAKSKPGKKLLQRLDRLGYDSTAIMSGRQLAGVTGVKMLPLYDALPDVKTRIVGTIPDCSNGLAAFVLRSAAELGDLVRKNDLLFVSKIKYPDDGDLCILLLRDGSVLLRYVHSDSKSIVLLPRRAGELSEMLKYSKIKQVFRVIVILKILKSA
jgi:hypothetical protein